jgi:PhnB protein
MQSRLNPYLSFENSAREAMEFYKSVFGGKLDVTTFKESHIAEGTPEGNLVMHAMLTADNGIVLMGADTPPQTEYKPGGDVSLSLSGDDEAELRGYFDKLSEGGAVSVPLDKAPWGDTFGMFTDKFGKHWMVNISANPAKEE